jgi:molybdopterin molybdotransferase
MLSLEQAQEAILHGVRRCRESETVNLALAHGRYLATPMRAAVDYPAFDNSSMDGYALSTSDLSARENKLPVLGESRCGSAPETLTPGTAMRIFTGAPLPAGADAVVIQEDVRHDGSGLVLPKTVQAGQNIRRRGGDFQAGDLLYEAGRRLGAFDLSVLASAGIALPPVYRRARVLVVSTGDELATPGNELGPGQVYESNRLVLALQLQRAGVDVTDGGIIADDTDALRGVARRGIEYDFVITSGGASVGDRDLVKQVFGEFGEIHFWKARIKPGKPIAFGYLGERTHFFALPGNPVSSLVTYKMFVEPALTTWHHGRVERFMLNAAAANDFNRQPGRTEFLRARLHQENGKLLATALRGQESHMVGTLRDTNALIRIEADSHGFHAGDNLAVVPLRIDWD